MEKKSILKRVLATGIVVTMTTSLLLGCGGGSSDNSKESSKSKDGKTELVMWTFMTKENSYGKAFYDAVDAFSDSSDEYTVKIEQIPFSQLVSKITVAAQSKSLPDIIQVDGCDHASFSAMGIFADLTDKVESEMSDLEFYDGPLESCKYDDKLYGLPLNANNLVLVYNDDMLQEAGYTEPPKTWDELREYAKKLTTDSTYGFAINAIDDEGSTYSFMPFLYETGADWNTLDKGADKALGLYQDLMDDGSMSKEAFGWGQNDAYGQFVAKRAAMYIDGNWRLPELEKDADFNYKFAAIPAYDGESATCIGGENLAIVNNDNVEGSWECIKSLFNKEMMNDYCKKSGMIPTVKTFAMEDSYFTDDPVMKVFVENMDVAKTRGPSPIWPQISQVIRDMIQEVGTGVDAETAAQDGIKAMEEYVNK